jgi:hypothetical protein
MVIYQGAITPSYDIGRRNWAAGIAYTRYFNKDSLSFGVNPLRNDVYWYGIFKKYWLQPGIAFDWSFDAFRYHETFVTGDIVDSATAFRIHAHTLAGVITLQHDFEWFSVVSKEDHLAFTPTMIALADAANYDISISKKLSKGEKPDRSATMRSSQSNLRGSTSPRAVTDESGPSQKRPQPPLVTTNYSSKESLPWAFESVGTMLNGIYTYKHFLVSSQVLATYFLHVSQGISPFRVSYLLSVGLVF